MTARHSRLARLWFLPSRSAYQVGEIQPQLSSWEELPGGGPQAFVLVQVDLVHEEPGLWDISADIHGTFPGFGASQAAFLMLAGNDAYGDLLEGGRDLVLGSHLAILRLVQHATVNSACPSPIVR